MYGILVLTNRLGVDFECRSGNGDVVGLAGRHRVMHMRELRSTIAVNASY